jgi:hypothetical protein
MTPVEVLEKRREELMLDAAEAEGFAAQQEANARQYRGTAAVRRQEAADIDAAILSLTGRHQIYDTEFGALPVTPVDVKNDIQRYVAGADQRSDFEQFVEAADKKFGKTGKKVA